MEDSDDADMDPFEIHLQFVEMLKQNLSSARHIQNICNFCYKYKSQHLEIYQSLLENLKAIPPLKRLSLFYLVDSLVKHQQKYKFKGYAELILNSIQEIVDIVFDIQRKDGKLVKNKTGLANVPGVKKVLVVWKQKEFISDDRFTKLDKYISSFNQSDIAVPKEHIWRRMEDDRERQKRSREESWNKNSNTSEFEMAWKKAKELTSDDYLAIEMLDLKYQISREKNTKVHN